jgi:hypothetical protein
VAGSCEYGDETSGSGATELVINEMGKKHVLKVIYHICNMESVKTLAKKQPPALHHTKIIIMSIRNICIQLPICAINCFVLMSTAQCTTWES